MHKLLIKLLNINKLLTDNFPISNILLLFKWSKLYTKCFCFQIWCYNMYMRIWEGTAVCTVFCHVIRGHLYEYHFDYSFLVYVLEFCNGCHRLAGSAWKLGSSADTDAVCVNAEPSRQKRTDDEEKEKEKRRVRAGQRRGGGWWVKYTRASSSPVVEFSLFLQPCYLYRTNLTRFFVQTANSLNWILCWARDSHANIWMHVVDVVFSITAILQNFNLSFKHDVIWKCDAN